MNIHAQHTPVRILNFNCWFSNAVCKRDAKLRRTNEQMVVSTGTDLLRIYIEWICEQSVRLAVKREINTVIEPVAYKRLSQHLVEVGIIIENNNRLFWLETWPTSLVCGCIFAVTQISYGSKCSMVDICFAGVICCCAVCLLHGKHGQPHSWKQFNHKWYHFDTEWNGQCARGSVNKSSVSSEALRCISGGLIVFCRLICWIISLHLISALKIVIFLCFDFVSTNRLHFVRRLEWLATQRLAICHGPSIGK